MRQILGASGWLDSTCTKSFRAVNPVTGQEIGEEFPFSSSQELDSIVPAAYEAWMEVMGMPPDTCSLFLMEYAKSIDAAKAELARVANEETALPIEGRFIANEIPRTVNQLRLAAAADWRRPHFEKGSTIRSCRVSIGPVVVFGPNNFPFGFNGISGGDFAAAVAGRNPVIAKAHPGHPETSRMLADLAETSRRKVGLPNGFVQMIYQGKTTDFGEMLVSHPLVAATGFTGSRQSGLLLQAAAERAHKLFYGEYGSVNPVVITPEALMERSADILGEFLTSVLMGCGQFCTNPGLIVMLEHSTTEAFLDAVRQKFEATAPGYLFSKAVQEGLARSVSTLISAGAVPVCGGGLMTSAGFQFPNTLLRVSGTEFLNDPVKLQTEAFGNVCMAVVAKDAEQLLEILRSLEGSLTGCVYTARQGGDETLYQQIEFELQIKVGRFLNDKMPTGVAVHPDMVHGGPFPASNQPGFTSVGIPASIDRFTRPLCFDAVRPERLPECLRDLA